MRRRWWIGAGAAACVASGCARQQVQAPPPPEPELAPMVSGVAETQAARGALADPTLRAAHFDGDALNSLGMQKLRRIVAATPTPLPLRVFVDAGDAPDAARRDAVARAAAEMGWGGAIDVREGRGDAVLWAADLLRGAKAQDDAPAGAEMPPLNVTSGAP